MQIFAIEVSSVSGGNEQVRRVHLADGRSLRTQKGAFFPNLLFYTENREYLAQLTLAFGRREIKFLGVQKLQGAQRAYKKTKKKWRAFFVLFLRLQFLYF